MRSPALFGRVIEIGRAIGAVVMPVVVGQDSAFGV